MKKSNFKYLVSAAVSVLAVFILLMCSALAAATPERTKIELDVGDTYTIDTGRTIGSDDFLSANWYSSDSSVLKINGDNYNKDMCGVTALKSSAGEIVYIRVEYEYLLEEYPYIPGVYKDTLIYYFVITGETPQSISLPKEAQVTDSSYIQLTPVITPETAETKCEWSSSDSSVAEVDDEGNVTGKSKGTAVITAETVNGLKAECTVTVRSSRICGDDLEWSFENGTLTISGTGEMYDYSDDSPWNEYNEEISKIVVEEGVTSIGSYAFAESAVSEVVLPDSLTEIGDGAFCFCDKLESITIPKGVRKLGEDPFESYSIKSIEVNPDNLYFTACNGVLFSKDMTRLIRYPQGREGDVYSVAEYVDTISFAAFYNTNLKTIYIPETVNEIEYYGLSTIGMTVYSVPGSATQKAVEDYVALGGTMYFKDIALAEQISVSVGNAYGVSKDRVRVPVILSGNTGFANLNIQISYDTEVLSLTDVQNTDIGAVYAQGSGANTCNMSWDSGLNNSFNGTIAILEFEIIQAEFSGRTPININFYSGKNKNYTDGTDVNYTQNFTPLNLVYTNGSIAEPKLSRRIDIDNINISGGINFDIKLLSEEIIDGVVIAAVYDSHGNLTGVKIYDAAETVSADLGSYTDDSQLSVMWVDSTGNMEPMAKAKNIDI